MIRRLNDPFALLRAIPLEKVLPLCAARPDGHDPHKWHTPVGILSVTGPKFINWNRQQGGGGAIDLVIHLQGLNFKAAVAWLEQHFPVHHQPTPFTPPTPAPWKPPSTDPSRLSQVRDYLVGVRKLPSSLVQDLIQRQNLYADARANAVFLLLGKENSPVGAELRGTTQRSWRGLAPGSRKDLGFFSIPAVPPDHASIILCESAIDAISCHALHPDRCCLSTAGARSDPVWLPALLAKTSHVTCGFDCDPAGEAMANAMIERHPAIQRLRPSAKDWNDMLRAAS